MVIDFAKESSEGVRPKESFTEKYELITRSEQKFHALGQFKIGLLILNAVVSSSFLLAFL